MRNRITIIRLLAGFVLAVAAMTSVQANNVLVVNSSSQNEDLNAALLASPAFSNVDSMDVEESTPTLSELDPYDLLLVYTDVEPDDPEALGDVLADYVDTGHCIALATYAFSQPWAIGGRIMTSGYSPFVISSNGSVSGNLNAVQPGHPIFDGIDLDAVSYFNNSNYSHPDLDSGVTLLATDGDGINMIAVSGSSQVYGMNLFLGDSADSNEEFYQLVVNVAEQCAAFRQTEPLAVPVLDRPALAVLVLMMLLITAGSLRRLC